MLTTEEEAIQLPMKKRKTHQEEEERVVEEEAVWKPNREEGALVLPAWKFTDSIAAVSGKRQRKPSTRLR